MYICPIFTKKQNNNKHKFLIEAFFSTKSFNQNCRHENQTVWMEISSMYRMKELPFDRGQVICKVTKQINYIVRPYLKKQNKQKPKQEAVAPSK